MNCTMSWQKKLQLRSGCTVSLAKAAFRGILNHTATHDLAMTAEHMPIPYTGWPIKSKTLLNYN